MESLFDLINDKKDIFEKLLGNSLNLYLNTLFSLYYNFFVINDPDLSFETTQEINTFLQNFNTSIFPPPRPPLSQRFNGRSKLKLPLTRPVRVELPELPSQFEKDLRKNPRLYNLLKKFQSLRKSYNLIESSVNVTLNESFFNNVKDESNSKIYLDLISSRDFSKENIYKIYNTILSINTTYFMPYLKKQFQTDPNISINNSLNYINLIIFDKKMVFLKMVLMNFFPQFLTDFLSYDSGFISLPQDLRVIIINKTDVILHNFCFTVFRNFFSDFNLFQTNLFMDITYTYPRKEQLSLLTMSNLYTQIVNLMSGKKYYANYIFEPRDQFVIAKWVGNGYNDMNIFTDYDLLQRLDCEHRKIDQASCESDGKCNLVETSAWPKVLEKLQYFKNEAQKTGNFFDYDEKYYQTYEKEKLVCRNKNFENQLTPGNIFVDIQIKSDNSLEFFVFIVEYQAPLFDNFGLVLRLYTKFTKSYRDWIDNPNFIIDNKLGKSNITQNEYYHFFPVFNPASFSKGFSKKDVKDVLDLMRNQKTLTDQGLNNYIYSNLVKFYENRSYKGGKNYFIGVSRGGWCANIAPFVLNLQSKQYEVFAYGSPNPGKSVLFTNPNFRNVIRSTFVFNTNNDTSGIIFDPFATFPQYSGAENFGNFTNKVYSFGSLLFSSKIYDIYFDEQPVISLLEKGFKEVPESLAKQTVGETTEKILSKVSPSKVAKYLGEKAGKTAGYLAKKASEYGIEYMSPGSISAVDIQIEEYKRKYCLSIEEATGYLHNVAVYAPYTITNKNLAANQILTCKNKQISDILE